MEHPRYNENIDVNKVVYCKMHDIFVDEQNGFSKNRACVDHVYTLTSIIRKK